MRQFDAKPADAGFGADWYDAVGFCRWLGQQSGLSEGDQSYAAPETLDKAKYPREPNPEANWAPRNWPLELGRRGFRLPTESEWEVASRAGARTPYGFGSEVSLLGRFGWFAENSGKHVHPPRELRPSIRGLFDLHGNLFEWTHDWYGDFGETAAVDSLGAKEGSYRVLRGGSWSNDAAFCRSAIRDANAPTARTIQHRLPPGPESVWSHAGGGTVKGAEPSGGGTEGASSGAATGDAVAGWRSGFDTRSHAPRGNAVFDAPRHLLKLRTRTHVTQPLSVRRSRFSPLPDLTHLLRSLASFPCSPGPRPFKSCSIPGSFFRIRIDLSFSDTSSSRTDLRLNQRPRQPVDPRGQFMVRPHGESLTNYRQSSRLTSCTRLGMRQSLCLVVVTAIDHRQGSNNG